MYADVTGRVRALSALGTVDAAGETFEWNGLHVHAEPRPTTSPIPGIVFFAIVGDYDTLVSRWSIERLLEDVGGLPWIRLAVVGPMLRLESFVVTGERSPDLSEQTLRTRLDGMSAVAAGWRERYGLMLAEDELTRAQRLAATAERTTLAELKRMQLAPDQALRVAAVAFGVAGADGQITDAERSRLRTWLADVPAFAAIEPGQVVRVIADLVTDPGRHLMEAARKLDDRALLLAWALASEMALTEREPSIEAERYLSNVATVFRLPSAAVTRLGNEAREQAAQRRGDQ